MRTGTVLFLLAAAAAMATVTGAVAAGDEALEGGADTWPGHAVSDGDVARGGRAGRKAVHHRPSTRGMSGIRRSGPGRNLRPGVGYSP